MYYTIKAAGGQNTYYEYIAMTGELTNTGTRTCGWMGYSTIPVCSVNKKKCKITCTRNVNERLFFFT